jgi:hypothetical protein
VPSALRGLDRIEYASYTEHENMLGILLEQRYPKRPRPSIDAYLEDRREEVRKLLQGHPPGLTMRSISQLLGVEVSVAQLIVKPLVDSGELESTGVKKSTKYSIKGVVKS